MLRPSLIFIEARARRINATVSRSSRFLRCKGGDAVDYNATVSGKLQLVPDANGLVELKADYQKMTKAGLFFGEPETFEELMKLCREIEKRANSS
jgi:hypothetical protein